MRPCHWLTVAALALYAVTLYCWTSVGKRQTCVPFEQRVCLADRVQYCKADGRAFTSCLTYAEWGAR